MRARIPALGLLMALAIFLPGPALAQSLNLNLGEGGELSARIIQFIALLTVLSLAPSILVMVTSFTRIVIVLSLLRSALGVQQTPPNTVLISLAMFLTLFIMGPVFEKAYEDGIVPLINQDIDEFEAFDRGIKPFRGFMLQHVREKDLTTFMDMAKLPIPEDVADTPLQVLVPAFIVSELRRAFEIGFLIFIPFIVIDMVVASVLMSMGMMMLPPIMIALPFKLIFFVLVDGWSLITSSLVQSFG
ncbi:MAG: flagellar type III secretion system pore protein FliP [Rhodospirillaceae bacterium]|jgi:flagellar biosynthesis protein FliP|nr:flagellar type III secretion system pore protein FliP [Rhodospirillaceae bacterium]MBT5899009.1 flagellar type III secretion system pore protein FliP [Rhodospirillaceae bacterium]MBT6427230.1 flagellar type III secretion system pore protein FliP [Rhodospirillaceae bacterium]MBT7760583.1 flagellar type III secretion system pore protein FliP [Rhodospirillaceae bacterium]